MSDPVIVEVAIAAPIEATWRALREPSEIRRWHGWDYDDLEAEITAIYIDEVTASDEDLSLDTGAGRFQLEPRDGATLVRVTRPTPSGEADWNGIYDEINEGWLSFTQQLRYYLERHPGEDRRTFLIDAEIQPPAGEPWFKSDHQIGVQPNEHSLVIVTPERTIVSTYGLDEPAIAALKANLSPA
ncbi:MAG TPA: hypothetical protein VEW07_00585 [Solirubrobacterales bacterium]|nr:hypothetical protein [Solirubrobacterales bacterium]